MDETQVRHQLREFILTNLIQNPHYPLRNDESLINGGLIASFDLAQIGVFAEDAFGVYIPDPDLTVAKMDTLDLMVARVLAG